MGGEVDDHTDVADARRERSLPPGLDLVDPPDLASGGADHGLGLVAHRHQLHAVEVAEHAQVVATHRAETDEGDSRHAVVATLRTASTIRSRSDSLRPGCTGRDRTWSAACSETGMETDR